MKGKLYGNMHRECVCIRLFFFLSPSNSLGTTLLLSILTLTTLHTASTFKINFILGYYNFLNVVSPSSYDPSDAAFLNLFAPVCRRIYTVIDHCQRDRMRHLYDTGKATATCTGCVYWETLCVRPWLVGILTPLPDSIALISSSRHDWAPYLPALSTGASVSLRPTSYSVLCKRAYSLLARSKVKLIKTIYYYVIKLARACTIKRARVCVKKLLIIIITIIIIII